MNLESALLSGIPVGIGQCAHCDVCNDVIRPNNRVECIVAIDAGAVDVAVTRGLCCSRGSLRDGTEVPCWLVSATLATSISPCGRSRVILAGARVVDRT